MRPIEFLTFAATLVDSPTTDAAGFRTAASRAYYCAFHVVKDFVENDVGAKIRGGRNEHLKLQQALRNSGVDESQVIGGLLMSLHVMRKVADYDLFDRSPENADQAADAVGLARRILALVDGIRGDADLMGKVKSGVQAYVAMRNRGS